MSLTSCNVAGKLFGYGTAGGGGSLGGGSGGGVGGGSGGGSGGGTSTPVVYVGTDDAGLAVSRDSGATWTTYNASTAGFGSDVVHSIFVSGSTIYAGLGGSGNRGLSISTDQGATWTNRLTGYNVQGIWASGSTIYAATNGGLQKSTNGGASFTVDPTINSSVNSWAVVVSGSKISVGTNGGGVYTSLDGGGSWTQHSAPPLYGGYAVSLVLSGGTLYAATSTAAGAGAVSMTPDDGVTWSSSTTATTGWPAYAVFASGSSIYVGHHIGAAVSTDAGTTWTQVYSADKVNGVASAASKLYLATQTHGLQVSSDGGASWSTAAGVPSSTVDVVVVQ